MAEAKAPAYDDASWLGRTMNWIDARFPLTALWNSQVAEYYAPKNMNFWYFFGSLALLVLVIRSEEHTSELQSHVKSRMPSSA